MPAFTKAGPGRPKGLPNKTTIIVKDAILAALEEVGGAKYLATLAREQPVAFSGLLGRILPTQITGDGGGPVMIITGVPRAED